MAANHSSKRLERTQDVSVLHARIPSEIRAGLRTPTIDDVAALAGVSTTTVSRVVNNEKNVRDTTRATVLAAAEVLKYTPNPAARSLAAAETERVGLLYANPSAAFLSEILLGTLDETSRTGAQLALSRVTEDTDEAQLAAVTRLLQSNVIGVVLIPPLSESKIVMDRLREANIRAVAVASRSPDHAHSTVRIDERAAAFDMAQHLLQMGHRHFGFVKGNPNQISSHDRLEGFREALATQPGCTLEIVQGFYSFESALAAGEALLDLDPRPTTIFASNDDMAAAIVSVAHRRNLDVPRDVSVVGFDDTAIATTIWPTLTTIRQPVREMTVKALEILLRETRAARSGNRLKPVEHLIPYTLIARDSAAPPSGKRLK